MGLKEVSVQPKEAEKSKLTKSGDDRKPKDFSRPTRELSDDTPQKSDESRNGDAKRPRVGDLMKSNQKGQENTSEQQEKKSLGEKLGAEVGRKAGKEAGREGGSVVGAAAGGAVVSLF